MANTTPGPNIDSETLSTIQAIAARFRGKIFPGYADCDIEQEAVIMMMEALPRYRPEFGKLEHFLSSHARRRLANLRRNKHARPKSDCPCESCILADERGEPGPHDGEFCERYAAWQKRNRRKMDLSSSYQTNEEVSHAVIDDGAEQVEINEILQIIEERLDDGHKPIWHGMRDGQKYLCPDKREDCVDAIGRILVDSGHIDLVKAFCRS
jgi:hypothetical protein